MRYLNKAVLAAGLLASAFVMQAQAQEESGLTANVTLASDYRFRGISQTDRQAAIQGGFEYGHSSGAYAGIWASNVDYGDSIEMDYYAGFRGMASENFGYDIGVLFYDYPGISRLNTLEFYGEVSYSGLSAKLSLTDDYFGSDARAYYMELGYGVEVVENLTLDFHAGRTEARKTIFGNEDYYYDYGVALSTEALGANLSLGLVDTNLSKSECGFTNDCDSRAVVSLSKSF